MLSHHRTMQRNLPHNLRKHLIHEYGLNIGRRRLLQIPVGQPVPMALDMLGFSCKIVPNQYLDEIQGNVGS